MQLFPGWIRLGSLSACLLLVGLFAGCNCLPRRTIVYDPVAVDPITRPCKSCNPQTSSLVVAEAAYAEAVRLENNLQASCIDAYYRAATLAWQQLAPDLADCGLPGGRAAEIYHSSVSKLISEGPRFQRFDPSAGLAVQTPTGPITVRTVYHGFPWQPQDFGQLSPVGEYRTGQLNNTYSYPGLGVTTVAERRGSSREAFRTERQRFAATAVLRPTSLVTAHANPEFTIDLFDPLRVSEVEVLGRMVSLRRDISAPFVDALRSEPRNYFRAFLQPGSTDRDAGLFMLEPYQPGKIPVVFVHGLLSDPITWANTANEIRARPDLMGRYQIWGFEYATGAPFLQSAATLRRELYQARRRLDPLNADPALSQIVLIGHSMGGLVAKLQITHSGDSVWQAVSTVPLPAIVTTPATRANLAQAFFFEPVPLVTRVVYIGTPHRGSPWARRPIGHLGASLVEEPSSMQAEHQQLIRDNRRVFSREFTKRIPTSIDLLRPDSALLAAIDQLPIAASVRQHSIIGSHHPMIGAGDSDGVVPVASARHRGVVSETIIKAQHGQLHQSPEGIDELMRILREHLAPIQYRGRSVLGPSISFTTD